MSLEATRFPRLISANIHGHFPQSGPPKRNLKDLISPGSILAYKYQAIRGMYDLLPATTAEWQFVEKTATRLLDSYGYQEIRLPILEKTELFNHSIGKQTDIVTKEMYSFTDKNNANLALRPEGTASCVRAALQHGLLHNQTQKLWYLGPMFRRERPQQGRQRQFHQIGVEAYGFGGPNLEAEMLMLSAHLWQKLELADLTLEINTLGTTKARSNYRKALTEYFSEHKADLDEESRHRLSVNPLRILDSKHPDIQHLIFSAPVMTDYLDPESEQHFNQLKLILDQADIRYRVNPRLVRGLDYYDRIIFEWTTERLGAQGTICAGGRYDGLVEHFGGKATPALGLAMGLERIIALRQALGKQVTCRQPEIYLIATDSTAAMIAGLKLAKELREQNPGIKVLTHCGGGNLKSQLKRADKSGALYALILGDDGLINKTAKLKSLREQTEQEEISRRDIVKVIKQKLGDRLGSEGQIS